jgi:hypothetical protein
MNEIRALDSFPVPYAAIARLIERRSITLFLGAAASLVRAAPSHLPDGRQLTADLATLASYPGRESDPLTKVSQYLVEYAGGRDLILDYIKSRFHDEIPDDYRCSLTDFLSQIPPRYIPRLIVSTNYDTLIERLLERQSIPYLCISHVLGRSKYAGRLIVYDKLGAFSKDNILTRAEAEEVLQDRLSAAAEQARRRPEEEARRKAEEEEGRRRAEEEARKRSEEEAGGELIILYKMHGSAVSYVPRNERDQSLSGGLNSIVLTEQDYIDFLDRNTMQRLPIQVQKMLYQSQFLFLGYSLEDWNFRLLLHRLRENQAGADTKHWACLLHSDPVESMFWQKRGVNIHHVSLDQFLEDLKHNLTGGR